MKFYTAIPRPHLTPRLAARPGTLCTLTDARLPRPKMWPKSLINKRSIESRTPCPDLAQKRAARFMAESDTRLRVIFLKVFASFMPLVWLLRGSSRNGWNCMAREDPSARVAGFARRSGRPAADHRSVVLLPTTSTHARCRDRRPIRASTLPRSGSLRAGPQRR